MRSADILKLSMTALWQQKVRTLLTAFGVVIGTFALAVTLSVGFGVQAEVLRQFQRGRQLRQITVRPGYDKVEASIPADVLTIKGEMSEAKRERLRKAVIRNWNRRHYQRPRVPLTQERLLELAALNHVEGVAPLISYPARVITPPHPPFTKGGWDVSTFGSEVDSPVLANRIVAGSFLPAEGGRFLVIHEYLLYRWGITTDEDVARVVGQTVQLEWRISSGTPGLTLLELFGGRGVTLSPADRALVDKVMKRLPDKVNLLDLTAEESETLKKLLERLNAGASPTSKLVFSEEFTIVGVIRDQVEGDRTADPWFAWTIRDADVILPVQTATDLFGRSPHVAKDGFNVVTVTVDREENVKEVAREIKEMGLEEFSLTNILERVRRNIVLMTFAGGFLAAVALLVSCLGITNTMIMCVLERTHEIGVMKAVGARNSHIQLIFLLEGALIGVLGGALGLLLSWLASFPGDSVARKLMEEETHSPLTESLFIFPLWLSLGAPAFAALVTTLAAVYPSRRAARINPIKALRHE